MKLTGDAYEVLKALEARFEARYRSYRQIIGKQDTARAWKRAWLDLQREARKLEPGHEIAEESGAKPKE